MTRVQVMDALATIKRILADPAAPLEIAELADLELRTNERLSTEQAYAARQLLGIERARQRYLP